MDRDWEIITKIEAAHRQLLIAMLMYFADSDIVATHTLVCAAREIYEKHCKLAGVARYVDRALECNPELDEKTLWKHFNAARNFFKHPEATGDLLAKMELSGAVNKVVLYNACMDCMTLCSDSAPPFAKAFFTWHYATDFTRIDWDDPTELQNLGELVDQLEEKFPRLRSASEGDQKAFGARLIAHAAAHFETAKDWADWTGDRKFDFRQPIEIPQA